MIPLWDYVKDPDILNDNYVPPDVPARETQKQELVYYFKIAERGLTPFTVLCYGPPGTGKTAVIKHILNQFELHSDSKVSAVYVNCWERGTINSVLDFLLAKFGSCCTVLNSNVKIARLKEAIRKKRCVIIFDEFDRLEQVEKERLLYNICESGTTGIIAITNSKYLLLHLDNRLSSRTNTRTISFGRYSSEELFTILRYRADAALAKSIWTDHILRRIAELAEGDARVAIQTLKFAVAEMVKHRKKKIDIEALQKGWEEAKDLKKSYLLNKLTEHHKIIYNVIKACPGILSGDLYKEYKKKARGRRIEPIAIRTFTEYVQKMEKLELIITERAKIRGKVRRFKCA